MSVCVLCMHIYFKIKHTQQAHSSYFENPLHKLTFTLQMVIITYLWELCIPLHESYKDLQANIRNLFPSIPNEFPPLDKRPPKKPGKRKKRLWRMSGRSSHSSVSHIPPQTYADTPIHAVIFYYHLLFCDS